MKTNLSYDMYIPTRTLFGAGALNELHKQPLPGKKALLVISNGKSTRANGYLDRTVRELEMAGASWVLFEKIPPNPLLAVVNEGGALAREQGCDMVVALGGGSVMDAAKAIAAIATSGGSWWDYIGSGTGKGKPLSADPLPLIAITTTAGTGSETDNRLVITNPETHEKTGFGHLGLFPRLAIVDPELMLTVPPLFTAYQGFDALFHSIEGFISNRANLMSDMYAEKAIAAVARNLPRCVRDGSDREARTLVAWGNTLSGMVMCISSLTSEHSLEHALSAYHQELPHGAGLIMISLAYFRHFVSLHLCDERFIAMARLMGMENAKHPEDFLTALADLQEKCGVPDLKMSAYGIAPEEFPTMVKNARETMGFLFARDRAPLEEEHCHRIYTQSFR